MCMYVHRMCLYVCIVCACMYVYVCVCVCIHVYAYVFWFLDVCSCDGAERPTQIGVDVDGNSAAIDTVATNVATLNSRVSALYTAAAAIAKLLPTLRYRSPKSPVYYYSIWSTYDQVCLPFTVCRSCHAVMNDCAVAVMIMVYCPVCTLIVELCLYTCCVTVMPVCAVQTNWFANNDVLFTLNVNPSSWTDSGYKLSNIPILGSAQKVLTAATQHACAYVCPSMRVHISDGVMYRCVCLRVRS
jgi:hypothetical protein